MINRTGEAVTLPTSNFQPPTSHGLTLIEVLVSVVILSCGAVAVMQGLARAAYAASVAEQQTAAHVFALSKMSELELAVRRQEPLKPQESGDVRVGEQTYRWEVTAKPISDDSNLQYVSLVVSWSVGLRNYAHEIVTWLPMPEKPS